VLKAKELRVLRPHGHIVRTGQALTPEEASLTSTMWMAGVFNAMLTQGHVSINRFLSTTRSYLSLLRSMVSASSWSCQTGMPCWMCLPLRDDPQRLSLALQASQWPDRSAQLGLRRASSAVLGHCHTRWGALPLLLSHHIASMG